MPINADGEWSVNWDDLAFGSTGVSPISPVQLSGKRSMSTDNDDPLSDDVLNDLRDGRLSIDQAVAALAGGGLRDHADPPPVPAVPLIDLLDRLGTPPTEIVDRWRDQLPQLLAKHPSLGDGGLPLNQFSVDASGGLVWTKFSRPESDSTAATAELTEVLPGLERQRMSVDDSPTVQSPTVQSPTVQVERVSETVPRSTAKREPTATANRIGPGWLVPTGVVALLIAGGWVIVNALPNQTKTEIASTNENIESTVSGNPFDPSSFGPSAERTESTAPKEFFEVPDAADLETLSSDETFNLESMIPPMPTPTTPVGETALGVMDPTSSESIGDVPPTDGPFRSPVIGDLSQGGTNAGWDGDPDDDATADTPQPVRAAPRPSAIELPRRSDTESRVGLSEFRWISPELEFPFESDLRGRLRDGVFEIGVGQSVVARIDDLAGGGQFRWTDLAADSDAATDLVHGRLSDRGVAVHLRPTIQSDPWPFRLDDIDAKPSYRLSQPIHAAITRLDVALKLPDGLGVDWIEPIQPDSPRRTRGLFVVSDDESGAAVATRLDVRVGRSLTARIRTAARLDATMPFQRIGRDELDNYAAALTDEAAFIDARLAQLGKVGRTVRGRKRAIVTIQSDAAKTRQKQIQALLERVAELQNLVDLMEASGQIRFELSVPWPDSTQVLFATPSS